MSNQRGDEVFTFATTEYMIQNTNPHGRRVNHHFPSDTAQLSCGAALSISSSADSWAPISASPRGEEAGATVLLSPHFFNTQP
jgi:hypothetical protein